MKRTLLIIGLVILVVIATAAYRVYNKLTGAADLSNYPQVSTGLSAAGTYAGTLTTSDGRERSYVLHVPNGYASNKKYPLVVLLHGGYGEGGELLKKTKFAEKADSEGFIVVAPEGVGKSWNSGLGSTGRRQSEAQNVDDVAFMRQLVASLEAQLSIDPKRVYATGESAGGQMSLRLGCEAADIFAAIGPDVGPFTKSVYDSCKPAVPVAVVGIQGVADPLAMVNGGTGKDGGTIVSAKETMERWASLNGCAPTPSITHEPPQVTDGTSVDKYSYTGCRGGTAVTYYLVQGMGHSWPPQKGAAGALTGPTSHNINATDVFWAFFAAHPKP